MLRVLALQPRHLVQFIRLARPNQRSASMQLRVRGPSGQSTLEVDPNARLAELQSKIASCTGIQAQRQEILLGFPPRSLAVPQNGAARTVASLGILAGDSLIVKALPSSPEAVPSNAGAEWASAPAAAPPASAGLGSVQAAAPPARPAAAAPAALDISSFTLEGLSEEEQLARALALSMEDAGGSLPAQQRRPQQPHQQQQNHSLKEGAQDRDIQAADHEPTAVAAAVVARAEQNPRQLRVVSFNISGANVSASAPEELSLVEKHHQVALEVCQLAPDLLTLQEVHLGSQPSRQVRELEGVLSAAGYRREASAESHCGSICTYIHSSLLQRTSRVVAGADGESLFGPQLPVAAVQLHLQLPDGKEAKLFFAGCHLEPFAEGASRRLAQMQSALGLAARRGATHVVIAGDMNMRRAEDSSIEGLGLQDAHVATGRKKEHAFTWNTHVNQYYHGGHRYTARYDRLYCNENVGVEELQVVFNRPCAGRHGEEYYLSDHFGIMCDVQL